MQDDRKVLKRFKPGTYFCCHTLILANDESLFHEYLLSMKPLHYDAICEMLVERFGEPIGDREAAPTSTKKKDMGNRGFGSADLDECGMMPTEIAEEEIDEKAPPGGENVVKTLKKQKGVKNPFAVAWAMKNKGEF